MQTTERTVTVGASDASAVHEVSVAGPAYELWRFIYGRRDRAAIGALAWIGDRDAVLACGLPYPFTIPGS